MGINAKLADLTAASSPTGGELIYIEQGGNSRRLALGAVGAKLLDDTGYTGALTSIGVTAKGRALLDDTGGTTMLTTLGVTALGRSLLDDTGQTGMQTTLGFSAFIRSLLNDTGKTTAQNTLGIRGLNVDSGLTFDLDAPPTIDFMPTGLLGGSYDANHLFRSDDATAPPYTGMRATAAFSRVVSGTGSNNPNSDHALIALAAKSDLNSTGDSGEIGAIRGWAFQNPWSDSSAMLLGSYKRVGDGSASEGGMTSIEVTARRFTTNLSTYDHWMNCIVGFSPNPTSTWASDAAGARAIIGFYSEMHAGAGFANFVGITDGEETGTGTMTYLLAGFRTRSLSSRYFSVDDEGSIESIWLDGGVTGGSWKRHKDSASPAANDILWNDYWTGNDDAGNETNYARLYGAISDPTNGSEDGILQFRTMVAGTETDQLTIRNGLSVGAPTGGASGTGSVNLASVLYVNGTQVVGARGAAVADATDAASAITQLNALLARCRAHGLIAT